MTRLLIVKTSSLGDIIHMLPAITELQQHQPDIEIDWLVEESFQTVPNWHPFIRRVIPVSIRRWRKQLWQRKTWQEIKQLKQQLQTVNYDVVLDCQGLLKSAVIARWTGVAVSGYNANSIREPLAARFYQKRYSVSRNWHAIKRNRSLVAQCFQYPIMKKINYGLSHSVFNCSENKWAKIPKPYIVALHGTSRIDKEWSIESWLHFTKTMAEQGYYCVFPWGNCREKQRADLFKKNNAYVHVLPRCSLDELAMIIKQAKAVIGMDTGLMHIAAALNKKGIALYPVTLPTLTGVIADQESEDEKNNNVRKIVTISSNKTKRIEFICDKLLTSIN